MSQYLWPHAQLGLKIPDRTVPWPCWKGGDPATRPAPTRDMTLRQLPWKYKGLRNLVLTRN